MPSRHPGFAHIKIAEAHKHPKREWVKTLDKFLIFVALIGPAIAIPQIIQIFSEKNASGVSLVSWVLYALIAIPWGLYGYAHKEKPILISSILHIIFNSVVVVGILLYS